MLAAGAAALALPGRLLADDLPAPVVGLGAIAAARGIGFGSMVVGDMLDDPAIPLAAALRRDAEVLVPGLELKWSSLRPSPTTFNFAPADRLAQFAAGNGMALRGHTLVWHQALPAWFDPHPGRDQAMALLQTHIRTVCTHYAGRIQSWDVVNEPIGHTDDHPGGLRATPWLEALGPDYLRIALDLAHDADPLALRVINEFDLECNSRYQQRRRDRMLALLERLVRGGAPIDALGIQGHLLARGDPFDAGLFRRFLADVAALGLRILVTELDVDDKNLPPDLVRRDAEVAALYRAFLDVALDEPALRSVLVWGLSDRSSDLNAGRPTGAPPSRGKPLDDGLVRKPAWFAIADALRGAATR